MAGRDRRHSSGTAPTRWNGWTVKRFAGGSKIGGVQREFGNVDYTHISDGAFQRQRSIPATMHMNGIVVRSRQTACRELSQNSRPRCGSGKRTATTLIIVAAAASPAPPLGILQRDKKARTICACASATRATPASAAAGCHDRHAVASTSGSSARSKTNASRVCGFRAVQHWTGGIIFEDDVWNSDWE